MFRIISFRKWFCLCSTRNSQWIFLFIDSWPIFQSPSETLLKVNRCLIFANKKTLLSSWKLTNSLWQHWLHKKLISQKIFKRVFVKFKYFCLNLSAGEEFLWFWDRYVGVGKFWQFPQILPSKKEAFAVSKRQSINVITLASLSSLAQSHEWTSQLLPSSAGTNKSSSSGNSRK